MAWKLELPDIGEGVVEAEVQQWFVAPGDVVEEDQPIVEVMTDKATVVIPSPRPGRIVKLFWEVGELAKVHAPLVEIEAAGASAAGPKAGPGSPAEPRAPARGAGPGGVAPAPPATPPAPAPGQKALATPAVRAMARELGIDVNGVQGSGPGGRVTKDDLAAVRARTNGHARNAALDAPPAERREPAPAVRAPSPAAPRAPGAAPDGPPLGAEEEERIPLRGLRKRIAENMARSKRTAAHFTFVEQADVSALVQVKHRIADAAREEGAKVTYLPFVVKAVVAALKRHPKLNAALDEEAGEIVLKRRYDIGIATATDAGLAVPVVRGADRRSLLDLAREIERLAHDAKAGRSRPEDVGRSTFTITSLGALGGLFATPVLNHPEVGILGLHRIRPTPVVRDGQLAIRDVMHVSVTSDHRVVDGNEAAAFAYQVIRYLEDPDLLFMHMV